MSPEPTPSSNPSDSTATEALRLLATFEREAFPLLLRKLACWKGLSATRHEDVIADILQDLSLDCVTHAKHITEMPRRDRHLRWFRLAERTHYRVRLRPRQRTIDQDPEFDFDALVEDKHRQTVHHGARVGIDSPDHQTKHISQWLAPAARHLRNGRFNLAATASELKVHRRVVRKAWITLADGLGKDQSFVEFWTSRLVEALMALAADLLLDRGDVVIHGVASRRRPDPRACRSRLRRIGDTLSIRPTSEAVTKALRVATTTESPCSILEEAQRLAPTDWRIQLWRFEAELAAHQPTQAAQALRSAKHHHAPPIPVLLARARLAQWRGSHGRAHRICADAARRHPRDPRVLECVAPRVVANSARRLRHPSPRAESNHGSCRGHAGP